MKAIQTGLGVSATKALMMLFAKEDRLFEDPYAEKLLSPFYKFYIYLMRKPEKRDSMMRLSEKSIPGLIGWMLCRFRYIDDILKDTIAKKEIKTVVNLGAGFDCRAYYIPGMERMCYFEVDHPTVIKKKMKKMKKILGKLPEHVVYVPVDFEKQSLETELKNAGYDLTSKTLFIWEGVTQYISQEANDSTLNYVAKAASGSEIVFTYVLKSFIDGEDTSEETKLLRKKMLKPKKPLWIYGINPSDINNYLAKYSLSLEEDIGSTEMNERYMKKVNLPIFAMTATLERMVHAKVK